MSVVHLSWQGCNIVQLILALVFYEELNVIHLLQLPRKRAKNSKKLFLAQSNLKLFRESYEQEAHLL